MPILTCPVRFLEKIRFGKHQKNFRKHRKTAKTLLKYHENNLNHVNSVDII